jgi:flagellar basal body P-ring protein FlgI
MAAKKRAIKVKDKPELVRDSFSKAIINVDRNAYLDARSRKKNLIEQRDRLNVLENELNELKATQGEMLKLLKSLTNK